MIKFKYVILYVEDVEKSMNFYHQTFDIPIKFITPEKDYGELLTGETSLSFASIHLASSNIKQGFYLPNLKKNLSVLSWDSQQMMLKIL